MFPFAYSPPKLALALSGGNLGLNFPLLHREAVKKYPVRDDQI
jgi:hypothetical protein